MKRRRHAMGKLLLRTDVNYNEHSDFSIKQNHIQYGLNMIESYELSDELLEFVLSLTRIDIRKVIFEYLYTNRIPEKNENSNHNYDNKHHNIIKSLSGIRYIDNYDNNYYSIIKSYGQ